MKPIIEPIAIEKLEAELTTEKFVRRTNFGNNEVYIFDHHNSPNLMLEVGRLRELTFRNAGGGTGKETDIDEYDIADNTPYLQMIVWSPTEKKIIGGYRYVFCDKVPKDEQGNPLLATNHLFRFSEKFIKEYVPYTIELGRSFVHPDYQSTSTQRKSIFTLDNLWNGLGALTVMHPEIKYFFGKVTMYTTFDKLGRDLILYFMRKYCPDPDQLVLAHYPLSYHTPESELAAVFEGKDYDQASKILSQKVRERGENIPPLINSYMGLTPTLKTFGTAINDDFGDVEETGILLTIADIYPTKSKRHMESYTEQLENNQA